jgi:hypothetical protein
MGIRAITCPNVSGGWCIAQSTNATKPSHNTTMAPAIQTNLRFVVGFTVRSLRYCIHLKIALRRDPERIGHAIEERKHSRNVDRFSNLRLCPSVVTQYLHIFCCSAIGCFGHLRHVVEKCPFCWVEPCFIQLTPNQRLYRLFFCSLNPQEVSM